MQVRDLLKESGAAQRLEIQNTRSSGTNVAGVQQVEVNNTQDVLDVMARGETNRATADTKMNERSSRSHSVLTVIVDGYNTITGVPLRPGATRTTASVTPARRTRLLRSASCRFTACRAHNNVVRPVSTHRIWPLCTAGDSGSIGYCSVGRHVQSRRQLLLRCCTHPPSPPARAC